MKKYQYIAKDYNGKEIKGTYECESEVELLSMINERNLFCVDYSDASLQIGGKKEGKKLNTKDLAFNCRQLASMLSSGLSLVKALDILYKEQTNKYFKQIWMDIYQGVQKGQSFSEALSVNEGVFPSFMISMVSAGESSGSMDMVMERLSEHYEKENKMHNKIKGALIYPIVLICVGIIVLIFMITMVLPNFKSMFESIEMPVLTKVLFSIGDFITEKWYIVIFIILGIVGIIMYLLKNPMTKVKFDKFKITNRFIGKLVCKIYTARFARSMSALYSSGIPMVECLERSGAILSNTYISKKFQTIIEDVKQGDSLSASLQRAEIFESLFCSIVYVGEESGNLDEILTKTADFYEDESDSAIQRLVSILEPVFIVFLGVIIGFVLVAIFPALTAMYKSIK